VKGEIVIGRGKTKEAYFTTPNHSQVWRALDVQIKYTNDASIKFILCKDVE